MSDAVTILFAKDAKLLWLEPGAPASPEMFDLSYPLPKVAVREPIRNLSEAVRVAVDVVAKERKLLRPWILAGEVMYAPDEISDLAMIRPTRAGRSIS